MNRTLSDWASVTEIVSGIAVIISLVILIVGIRENTEVTRASVYENSINSMNDFRTRIIDDREIAGLWGAYQAGELEGLDQPDQSRVGQLIFMLFGVYEKSYYAQQYGVIGSSEWSRFEFQICRQYARVRSSQFLFQNLEVGMTQEFLGYIRASCSE